MSTITTKHAELVLIISALRAVIATMAVVASRLSLHAIL
jgi:hypothetical protein